MSYRCAWGTVGATGTGTSLCLALAEGRGEPEAWECCSIDLNSPPRDGAPRARGR